MSYPPDGISTTCKDAPEWIKLGLGNDEYICPEKGAIFPGDVCPDKMPDLSKHSSFMKDVLTEDMYNRLKEKRTGSFNVGLAKCIKTGVDNPGHPNIKTCGLVAGDEECYELFKEMFDPVIDKRHMGYPADAKHPTDLDLSKVHKEQLDPEGKYVLTARVRTGRSIRGFPLPPSCTFQQRRDLEGVITRALEKLEGDLKGTYYPLHGSKSFAAMPDGMDKAKQEELLEAGNLFQEPDSTLLLSSGCGRHWPDARGIFHNNDKNSFVWANEEDHMRIVSMQKGDGIQEVFSRFVRLCDKVQEVVKSEGYDFMHNDHLGYILTCPSNLGTGLRAGCLVKIPHVSAQKNFKKMLGEMSLQARGQGGVDAIAKGGVFDISNADRLGKSEIQLVNILIDGIRKLIVMEKDLESRYPPHKLSYTTEEHEDWIKKGLGHDEYNCAEKGATFGPDDCPDTPPDLSNHNSFMAEALKKDPGLYDKLKGLKTKSGVNLCKCIKTGMDNPGHPMIKTCGLVAGDEECYTLFKDLFDPVIDARHGGYPADAKHPTNLNLDEIRKECIDPSGKYVLTSRVRTGRSIRGFQLPPSISFEERRKLEKTIVDALLKLEGDLKGDYFPLNGSRSWEAMFLGMDEKKQADLLSKGNLFQEPDSTLLLASGCGRHWPDARGIFHNDEANCFVWLNEEDHMRIVSMETGCNIQNVIGRFVRLCNKVQDVVKADGHDFMHSDHHGYILTCPSNLGTGLRAGCHVKLPLFSAKDKEFKEFLNGHKLQARGQGGVDASAKGGVYDISNADRLGKSEVELCNILIDGIRLLIEEEQKLEAQQ